ncbi:MAG TPA: GNAT family N-acetyltransferase [Alphaproteobacteria bacterium]|nr:GNAT family N-acetyltransferase [Alphaproteobacteria bacterium]
MDELCDATIAAIESGGGFGWVKVPQRQKLERYWQGSLLVPERRVFIGKLDRVVAGAVQLVRTSANNEAQFFSGTLTGLFVSPWARKHGLGEALVGAVEATAWQEGCRLINLDLRATQLDAVKLYERLGYVCWGHHPAYAQVEGEIIPGRYYYKGLTPPE